MAPKFVFFTHYGGEKVSSSRFLAAARKNLLIHKSAISAGFFIETVVTSCEPYTGELDNFIKVLVGNRHLQFRRWPVFYSPAISRILCLFLIPIQIFWYSLSNDKPKLFAFYNTLASESVGLLIARFLCSETPCVLFYDDDLMARHSKRRVIDLFFWGMAKKFSNLRHVFAVNNFLAAEVSQFGIPTSILPCLVDSRPILNKLGNDCNRQLKICYSGGLEPEKGAELILELGINLSPDYSLDITGKGSMQSNFFSLSREQNNVFYHGCLEENDLFSLYLNSDIFLCLHTYMPGVFPFKLVEALYHGMIVITTPIDLPAWLSSLDGLFVIPRLVYNVDPMAGLLDQLSFAANYVQAHACKISSVQDIIESNCSVNSLGLLLKDHISAA